MPDFQFVCPFCETLLDCPEELDSVETECPICGETIVPVVTENEKQQQELPLDLKEEIIEEEQESQQNELPFVAKCPMCGNFIEFAEDLKYSKQRCPFCNKTVILNTVKKQEYKSENIDWDIEKDGLIFLSPHIKYDAHCCRHCKNIIIAERNLIGEFGSCPCCSKDIFFSQSNIFDIQVDNLDVFVHNVKSKAGIYGSKVFVYPMVIKDPPVVSCKGFSAKQPSQINNTDDIAMGCGALIFCVFILIVLGSCISSCDTSSTEMSEEAKTYLMLKEAEKKLEKRRKERAVENLVDLMDKGY